jgi:hypothetical protein
MYSDDANLSVKLDMWNAAGDVVCHVDSTWAGATEPLQLGTGLQNHDMLVVTPEHRDYIQFTMGSQSWTSKDNDKMKPMYCNTGSWDPKEGPICQIYPATLQTAASDIVESLVCYRTGNPAEKGDGLFHSEVVCWLSHDVHRITKSPATPNPFSELQNQSVGLCLAIVFSLRFVVLMPHV